MQHTIHPHHPVSRRQRRRNEAPASLVALAQSAGVRFNGNAPWDIEVRDPQVYRRILGQGSLGFGEAYMDGLWECHELDELFCRLLRADIDAKLGGLARLRLFVDALRHGLLNLQAVHRAFEVGERHYDTGNDVFAAMLDPTLSYSCAYWARADNLADAQKDKLDLICRKLELKPGERLLDIGCGWGGLAQYAAKHYGVEVLGITVSKEQQAFAEERCAGLPVTIELMDYRDVHGHYDKVVSVGMFEHVGPKNYDVYFRKVAEMLREDGLFLLHTIGGHARMATVDAWIERYIFPNGRIPAAVEIAAAAEGHFVIEDWHNFGQDYDRTLMAWWVNFRDAWPRLQTRYGERFYRMWKYYLHCSAGFFRSRQGQLWQVVFAKRGRREVYRSLR